MSDVIRQAQTGIFGLTVDVKQVLDDFFDLSHLGEFTDTPGPNRFDRQLGVLYGAELKEPDEKDYCLDDGRSGYEAFDKVYAEWLVYPYEVLADELGNHFERGQYGFFVPADHVPFSPSDWEHVEKDVIRNIVEKHGSLERASIKYAVEDWYRAESLGKDWVPTGMIVTIYKDDIELGSCSLWGVDSDAGDYVEEVLGDLLHGAVEDVADSVATRLESIKAARTAHNLVQAHPSELEKAIARVLEAFNDD